MRITATRSSILMQTPPQSGGLDTQPAKKGVAAIGPKRENM